MGTGRGGSAEEGTGGNRGSISASCARQQLSRKEREKPLGFPYAPASLSLGFWDGRTAAVAHFFGVDALGENEQTNKNSRGRVWISSFVFRKHWHHTYLRGTISLDRNEVILLMRARTFVSSLAVFRSSRVFVGSLVSFFLSFFLFLSFYPRRLLL